MNDVIDAVGKHWCLRRRYQDRWPREGKEGLEQEGYLGDSVVGSKSVDFRVRIARGLEI